MLPKIDFFLLRYRLGAAQQRACSLIICVSIALSSNPARTHDLGNRDPDSLMARGENKWPDVNIGCTLAGRRWLVVRQNESLRVDTRW